MWAREGCEGRSAADSSGARISGGLCVLVLRRGGGVKGESTVELNLCVGVVFVDVAAVGVAVGGGVGGRVAVGGAVPRFAVAPDYLAAFAKVLDLLHAAHTFSTHGGML